MGVELFWKDGRKNSTHEAVFPPGKNFFFKGSPFSDDSPRFQWYIPQGLPSAGVQGNFIIPMAEN